MTAMAIEARVPAMNMVRDAALCEKLFDTLRAATFDGVGITRESFGPSESRALDIVENAARECGLATERDAGGNLVATLAGTQAGLPFLACGSHLDLSRKAAITTAAPASLRTGRAADEARRLCTSANIKPFGLRGRKAPGSARPMGSSALFGRLTPDDLASPHAVTGRSLPIACAMPARHRPHAGEPC